MIEKLIVRNFPIIKHTFTQKTYFYFAIVFFLFNYYLYVNKKYAIIFFLFLVLIGYILNRENERIIVEENVNFEKLEKKMLILLPKNKQNYLYVDLNLLDYLYNIRAFRLKSNKMFNETVEKVNEFLGVYEKIKESNNPNSSDLQQLSSIKKQALNNFHSIIFRLTEIVEIQKHNEFRYVLEEKLNKLFLECLEISKGHINLNNFGYEENLDNNEIY